MVKIRFSKQLSTRGDTIVEVLIAIAVVSVVLAGAFASVRNSVNATRTAQEQGEALKLAESQVEQIKAAISAGTPDVVAASDFCINGGVLTAGCVNTNGIDYTTVVTHTAGSNEFVVRVNWNSLSGGINNVELDYRSQ